MSISPASVPQPEELPPAQSSGISFRIFLVVVAALVIGLGGLLYYVVQLENRFEQTQNSLESNLRAQGEVLERLSQRLEQAEGRDVELSGEVTVAKNRLGLTQAELQKARQITLQLAEQQQKQKQDDEQMATRLGQLQQEQVATKGALGGLSTDAAIRKNLCQVYAASGNSTSISYLEVLLRDRDAEVVQEASRAIRILRSKGF